MAKVVEAMLGDFDPKKPQGTPGTLNPEVSTLHDRFSF